MNVEEMAAKASSYLDYLCSVKPNRRTGSPGNREATAYFASIVNSYGYDVDTSPFDALDYSHGPPELQREQASYQIYVSPYSMACDVETELISVSTIDELENIDCEGKILLMRGPIAAEQLMPKKFVFYNPEHHQALIALLERRNPACIITATSKNPDQVGALYPFPLIVDGDFHIPVTHCRDSVGEELASFQGETFRLSFDARRIPSYASNVIAKLNHGGAKKIVFTAHIDAYENSPGASDNGSGTVVLMLLAEMLADYQGRLCIEIAALNGEDHYSVGGQMDYLERYADELPDVLLVINVDDVGHRDGRSAYSFYGCSEQQESKVERLFRPFDGLLRGAPWFNGDHMIFVQKGIPALAFTAEHLAELMRTVTHTSLDTPDIVSCRKLVEVAASLDTLARAW